MYMNLFLDLSDESFKDEPIERVLAKAVQKMPPYPFNTTNGEQQIHNADGKWIGWWRIDQE